jgi:predicted nucleotidyltransferase component of viral defense system
MISKEELMSVADETGLTPHVVEKDYVLGWLLAAINTNETLSPVWVFKGGTCLKKCYFETYRFSEDLDFTLKDEAHLDEEFLLEQFAAISEWIYDHAGIVIPSDRQKFDVYDNPRGSQSCEGRVYYESYFVSGKKHLPKIKVDLTADEVLVLPSARQNVFHTYSDLPEDGIHVDCYDYPEVFGEKVRALGERGRPRDLYDVINLYRNDHLPAPAIIRDVLDQKCAYKGIERPTVGSLQEYRPALEQNWEPMLSHQLPALPDLDVYWDTLGEFFDWLESEEIPARPALQSVSSSGELYRPDYGRLGLRTSQGSSLEIIRFAAGNRLCVDLDYTDNQGNRSSRIIEPYSLRRAQNGNVFLYAVRVDSGKIRAYKINQINKASITNKVFSPRYQIELSPTGIIEAGQQVSSGRAKLGLPGTRSRNQGMRPSSTRVKTPRRTFAPTGPTYIYRCPYCDKTFKRKKMNSRLNPHKTKDGYPCSGRIGIYDDTRY